MQTFLPYSDFTKSLQALDYRRLGKQRVETWQILNAIDKRKAGIKAGWINHPATIMWEDHKDALTLYGLIACEIWAQKGYEDNMFGRIEEHSQQVSYLLWRPTPPWKVKPSLLFDFQSEVTMPPWLGDKDFHNSHKALLLQKKYEYYKQYNWQNDFVPDWKFWSYIWP